MTSVRPPERISKTPTSRGRAEAVLDRPQGPVGAFPLAFELEHAVDQVLEHPRAGEAAFLGHVADQDHRDFQPLGELRPGASAASRT